MRRPVGADVIRVTPAVWSFVLALLLLGGALGRGYVLSYDMVWVPDLALGRDLLGLGSALPRAVPSDAVVAVLDEVLGGMLLQKLVLVTPLVAAGSGAAALVGENVVARLLAASVAVWNPFVVERLAIGHWPVLVGYGVLPWVLLGAARWRETGRLPALLPVLLVVGSLSATTGIVTGLAAIAAGPVRRARHLVALSGLVVCANLPWLVSGLLHVEEATSSADGAALFAPGAEASMPAPLTFLSLGGIWNAEVVPASRSTWLGIAFSVAFLALAAFGLARSRAQVRDGLFRPLLLCWATGTVATVLAWVFPDASGWLASNVPGTGVLRDTSRLLALSAPLTAALAGLGGAALVARLPDVVSRSVIAGSLAVLPVALMPDVALGLGGRLDAVDYPTSYEQLAEAARDVPAGDAVLLPFMIYRAPAWNNDHVRVVAPLGRYLGRTVVVDDRLFVDDQVIDGEDPRARSVRQALAQTAAEDRSAELRAAGIRYAVVEELPGVETPALAGTHVWQGRGLSLVDLGETVTVPSVSRGWRAAMGAAWVLWMCLPVYAVALFVRRGRRNLR